MIVRAWAPLYDVPDEVPAAALGPLEALHRQTRDGERPALEHEVKLLLAVFTPRQYRAIRWHGDEAVKYVVQQLLHGWRETHRGAPGPWIEEPVSCR